MCIISKDVDDRLATICFIVFFFFKEPAPPRNHPPSPPRPSPNPPRPQKGSARRPPATTPPRPAAPHRPFVNQRHATAAFRQARPPGAALRARYQLDHPQPLRG